MGSKQAANAQLGHKIRIPKIAENVFHRQRLIDLLHHNLDAGILTICAPAGYGKTTLLADFCNDLDIPVCWYSIDSADCDIPMFVNGIVESIRTKFPDFGRATRPFLKMTERVPSFMTQLTGTLVRDINNVPDYFLLVLDDHHLLDGSEADKLLNSLISRIPENCHILISSRIVINIPIVSTRLVHGQAFALGSSDLAFSSDEIKELLANQKRPVPSDIDIERLVQETEGWIIGLLLQFDRMRSGEKVVGLPSLSRQDVFSYLASEVYEHLPASIQRFLMKSSILDQIDPEFCDNLLGNRESGKILLEIQRRNLFLSSVKTERACYSYHPLFRDFLREKFATQNYEEFCRIHTKAAKIFKAEHRWQEAIDHLISAREYSKAKNTIVQVGQEMLNMGKWTSILKWIDALAKGHMSANTDILLLRAQCDIHRGRADEAVRELTQVIGAKTIPEAWKRNANALSWRSAAHRLAGNLEAAQEDIKSSIFLLEKNKGSAESLGEAYRRLGSIHLDKGNLPTALRCLKSALSQYSSISATEQTAAVHNALGVAYQRMGKLTESVMHLNLARQGWRRMGDHGSLAMVLNNLGLLYQCQGDFDRALKTFHSGLQYARESGYKRMEACILISTADLLRDACMYDEALSFYEEGLKEAEEVIEIYYTVCATAGIGETQRLLGSVEKAEFFIKQAISLAEEHGRLLEAALTSVRLGIVEYERGEYEKALSIFSKAAAHFKKVGDKEALARTFFHTAQTLFLCRRFAEAKESLMNASRLADELGYDTFIAIEGRNSVLLLQYAVSEGLGVKRFDHILDMMKDNGNRLKLQKSSSEIRVYHPESQKPSIEVFAFGEMKVLVNARVIPETDWRSSRALEMFFFLLSSNTPRTREQIATALWPDLSPAKSTSNFHITLYRVRHALFPGLVTIQDGRYRITPNLGIWFDMAEFSSIVDRVKDLTIEPVPKARLLQKAIDLYKGPFLTDIYSDWVENLRHELESKYLKALRILSRYYSMTGEYQAALGLLEKAAAIDPYDDGLLSEIERWTISKKTLLLPVREFQRYLEWLRNEDRVEHNTARLLKHGNSHQSPSHTS